MEMETSLSTWIARTQNHGMRRDVRKYLTHILRRHSAARDGTRDADLEANEGLTTRQQDGNVADLNGMEELQP